MHASLNLFSILIEDLAAAIFVGSSIITRGGDAKVHGRMLPVAPIELAELLLGASQADPKSFDLPEPALALGLGDAGDEVVADLLQPAALGRVRPEEGATNTRLSELVQRRLATGVAVVSLTVSSGCDGLQRGRVGHLVRC